MTSVLTRYGPLRADVVDADPEVDAVDEAEGTDPRAANQHCRTICDFILENAYQMPTELPADEGTIGLNKKQVAHLFEVLDHSPAKSVADVRKLLTDSATRL